MRLLLIALVASSCLVAQPDTRDALEVRLKDSLDRVAPACVFITENSRGSNGGFSGVIVHEAGLILVAGHCVLRKGGYVVHLPDGRRFPARPLGREGKIDMGMLQITDAATPLPHVELGSSERLEAGSFAFGVSYPGNNHEGRSYVVRFGRVLDPAEGDGSLNSTVLMEPGDSGGPLFDIEGRLIGIHSRIGVRPDENFDVRIDHFREHWELLKKPESFLVSKLVQDRMGIDFGDSDGDAAAVITGVSKDTFGADAQLAVGDRVVAINEKDVSDAASALRLLKRAVRDAPTKPLRLEIVRDSARTAILVPLRFPFDPNEADRTPLPKSLALQMPASFGKASASLVQIERQADSEESEVLGLGCVVSKRGHVIAKSSEIGDQVVVRDRTGTRHPATVISRDPALDLALLAVKTLRGGTPIVLAPEDTPARGSFVTSPRGLDSEPVTGVVGTGVFSVKTDLVIGIQLRKEEDGLVVQRVVRGEAADKAGVKKGDKILAVDAVKTTEPGQLGAYLRTFAAPTQVTLTLQRGDETLALSMIPRSRGATRPPRHAADRLEGGFTDRRGGYARVFAHDAVVGPRECGAPLFDREGRVLGITIARPSRTHCFAVPATAVREFLKQHQESMEE